MANESAVTSREKSATAETQGGAPSPNGSTQHPAGHEPAAPTDPRRRTLAAVLITVAAVGAVIYGLQFYQYSQTHVSTDDAYVTGNLVNVSPIIPGTLSKLTVNEGDFVKKGTLIARLDDNSVVAALNQAREAFRAAQTEIPQAQTGLTYQQETTEAAIHKAQAALRTQGAKTDAAKAQITLTQATVRDQVRQAEQQVATAEAQASQADAQLATVQEGIQAAQQTVETAQRAAEAAHENVQSANANYQKAEADVARYKNLVAQQAVTQQQYDVVQATYLTTQAALSGAQDQSRQAQSQVSQAKVGVQQAVAQAVASKRAAIAAHRQVEVTQAGLAIARANNTEIGIQENNYTSSGWQGSQAQADLATAQAGTQQVQMKRQQITTLEAQAAQAKAALANAQVQEDDTYIYAPSDGQVVRKGVNVGTALSPGQTIVTMTAGNDIWVEANFKETQMKGVREGESAEIDVDAFPGKIFKGKVESIGRATGASTALLPPDNATGNFTKVVQRIPIKIMFVPASSGDGANYATQDDINRLGQGMSVTSTVELGK